MSPTEGCTGVSDDAFHGVTCHMFVTQPAIFFQKELRSHVDKSLVMTDVNRERDFDLVGRRKLWEERW